MNVESFPMTPEGYAQRCRELEALRTDGRRELSERLGEARQDGDAGSAMLRDLLEEHVQLERRIAQLEAALGVAEIVEPAGDGRAELGSVVRVRDRSGKTYDYELAGPLESDPAEGRVSVAAPVGRALVGRRPGDSVEVETPRGLLVFEVVAVRPRATPVRKAA
jgi:transcription elongation factor GreA